MCLSFNSFYFCLFFLKTFTKNFFFFGWEDANYNLINHIFFLMITYNKIQLIWINFGICIFRESAFDIIIIIYFFPTLLTLFHHNFYSLCMHVSLLLLPSQYHVWNRWTVIINYLDVFFSSCKFKKKEKTAIKSLSKSGPNHVAVVFFSLDHSSYSSLKN